MKNIWRLTVMQNEIGASEWKQERIILEYEHRGMMWDALCHFDRAQMPGRYIVFTIEKIEVCDYEENDTAAGNGNDNTEV